MRIYFSGIGGVGIGPLSRIALEAGYDVCGSDKSPSLITNELESAGIPISFDQSGAFLQSEHDKSPLIGLFTPLLYRKITPRISLGAKKLGIKTSKRRRAFGTDYC